MRGGLITAAAMLGFYFAIGSVDWVAQQIGWIVTTLFFIGIFSLIGWALVKLGQVR